MRWWVIETRRPPMTYTPKMYAWFEHYAKRGVLPLPPRPRK